MRLGIEIYSRIAVIKTVSSIRDLIYLRIIYEVTKLMKDLESKLGEIFLLDMK